MFASRIRLRFESKEILRVTLHNSGDIDLAAAVGARSLHRILRESAWREWRAESGFTVRDSRPSGVNEMKRDFPFSIGPKNGSTVGAATNGL